MGSLFIKSSNVLVQVLILLNAKKMVNPLKNQEKYNILIVVSDCFWQNIRDI